MGKKLRNREIAADTDIENENMEKILPIQAKLSTSLLIKKLKSRFPIKKQFTELKFSSIS